METNNDTLTEGELLDLVLTLGEHQDLTDTRIDTLDQKVKELDKVCFKKKTNIITKDGVNYVVTPQEGDQFVRIFYTMDREGSFDSINRVMRNLSTVIGGWASKPGFHIIGNLTTSSTPMGTMYSVIVSVDRTHTSQEDII